MDLAELHGGSAKALAQARREPGKAGSASTSGMLAARAIAERLK